jgi:hypothetical protein
MYAWLRKLASATTAKRPAARPALLKLEQLEDRQVPTVTFHGGALLPHVEVQGLYVGDQWSANSTLLGQANRLEGFLGTVVNSTYMDALTNAGYGVGRGSFSSGRISLASLANGSTLDDSTMRSWVSSYISNHTLQAPDANRLYVLFVEPNVRVRAADGSTSASFRGYHGAFTGPGGAAVRYAVIAYPRGTVNNGAVSFLSDFDSITKTASHEIAEAVTDPDVGYRTLGWYDNAQNGEIGDIKNDRVIYLGGYAMQRVIDQHDFNMTPAQAASSRAVTFVLLSNGNLLEFTPGGTLTLAGGIASVSDQGIDNQGRAMVDVVTTGGLAYEYHDTAGWTYLWNSARSAVAGQGVSYVLFTNGYVDEYDDATGTWSYVWNGANRISAGTDRMGVNAVDVLLGTDAWEHSDDSGWHFIASGVRDISAGRQGISDYLTTTAVAHWHSEVGNGDVAVASNVAQITAGTDALGNYMIDLIYSGSGALWEYRAGASWVNLTSGVRSLSKGRLGTVDAVFNWGDAWEHSTSGWRFLTGNATAAV